MNRDERIETISLIIILAVAGCAFSAVSITGAEPALFIFSLPLLFMLMGFTPAVWSKLFDAGPGMPAQLSLTAAASTLPFYVLFSTSFPYPAHSIALITIFLAAEGLYWAFLYKANRILYSITLLVTGLIPLLVYSFIIRSSGSGRICAVSPFGYLYYLSRNEWRAYILYVLAAHTAPLICAFVIILLRREHSGSSNES